MGYVIYNIKWWHIQKWNANVKDIGLSLLSLAGGK